MQKGRMYPFCDFKKGLDVGGVQQALKCHKEKEQKNAVTATLAGRLHYASDIVIFLVTGCYFCKSSISKIAFELNACAESINSIISSILKSPLGHGDQF